MFGWLDKIRRITSDRVVKVVLHALPKLALLL